MAYLKEIEERHSLHNISQLVTMLEEEHIGELGVEHLRMLSGELD